MGNKCVSRSTSNSLVLPDSDLVITSVTYWAADDLTEVQEQVQIAHRRKQERALAAETERRNVALAQRPLPSIPAPPVLDLPLSKIVDDFLYYQLGRIIAPRVRYTVWKQLACGETLRSMHRTLRCNLQPVLILVQTADGCKMGALASCDAYRSTMNAMETFLFGLIYINDKRFFRVQRLADKAPEVRLQPADDMELERLTVGSKESYFCLTKERDGLQGYSCGAHILMSSRKSFIVQRIEMWSVWCKQ